MKVLNKIKSIYLLAIVAILSFCMLLFPAMPKTANAEGTMGEGSVEIKAARVVVQQYAQGVEKWAIMFKAEITQEQYNLITADDTVDVKFGMLIGPTAKLGEATDYAGLVENKFKAISYVGSVAGENVQKLEFVEGVAEYWGAIVYDDAQLNTQENGDKRVDAAEMDLTAVPFYTDGTTNNALLAQKKSATPRNILVESYLRQADGEAVVDGVGINADTTVKNYAGEIEYMPEGYDAYICRSTNRLMTGVAQGELAPANFNEPDVDFAIGGVARSATGEYEVYNAETEAEKLANLPKYGKVNVVAYSSEGVQVIKAQVAERVITRFADTTFGVEVEDATEDYLAKADSSKSAYVSIFQINASKASTTLLCINNSGTDRTNGQTCGVGVWYKSFGEKYDGLYVLGKSITIPSKKDYRINIGSAFSNNMNNSADIDAGFGRQSYTPPTLGLGFCGTFEGRGLYIDFQSQAKEGVFPSMFGATVKNVALLGLSSGANGGGLAVNARATTFENMYVKTGTVNNNHSDLNKGIVANVQDCDFYNFVAEVNTITDSVMTGALVDLNTSSTASGVGQGLTTAGVFSFRGYLDAYYYEERDAILYTDNYSITGDSWNERISRELRVKYFPNSAHSAGQGDFTVSWLNSSRTNNYNPQMVTGQTYCYDPSQSTIFTGTKGENVYALGSSPLYIGYQFSSEDAGGCKLLETARATVFVNDTSLQYNQVVVDEETGAQELVPTAVKIDARNKYFYTMSSIIDENGLFTIDDTDGRYSLGEIILRGKVYRHGQQRIDRLLGENKAEDVLEVRLVNQKGFYDVANAQEMASYVLAQETPFDAEFWDVTVDGIVSWRNLPQA